MAHDHTLDHLSPEEAKFRDLMNHADDFMKIELLRQAKSWYKKALAMNMQTDKVKERIAECERLLAYENKMVAILGSIAGVLIIGYFLFFN